MDELNGLKMFCFDGSTRDWIIARSKDEAVCFYISLIGHMEWFDYIYQSFAKAGISYKEFVDEYVKELPMDKDLTLWVEADDDDNDTHNGYKKITKPVSEYIRDAIKDGNVFPMYFASSEY